MMYYLYILKSIKDSNLYVGCTSNLKARLNRHKTGQVEATRSRRPFKLVYWKGYKDKSTAFQTERYFKSLYGYRVKRKIIKEFNKEISI
ncbi:MAG: hypothetical protein HW405_855 [Candidatus Berkelbacteria bacterium]|nr:hypothetical protein [Candidatus Berkelbacteria bacterium]